MQFQNLSAIRNETPRCRRSPIALAENQKHEGSIYSRLKRHQALLYFPIFFCYSFSCVWWGGWRGVWEDLSIVESRVLKSPLTAIVLGLIYSFASNSISFTKLGAPVLGMGAFRMSMI